MRGDRLGNVLTFMEIKAKDEGWSKILGLLLVVWHNIDEGQHEIGADKAQIVVTVWETVVGGGRSDVCGSLLNPFMKVLMAQGSKCKPQCTESMLNLSGGGHAPSFIGQGYSLTLVGYRHSGSVNRW